jgi:plastocyanin
MNEDQYNNANPSYQYPQPPKAPRRFSPFLVAGILVGVLLLAIGGAVAWESRYGDKHEYGHNEGDKAYVDIDQTETGRATDDAVVQVNAEGLSPASIRVRAGSTVTWQNESESSVRITSSSDAQSFDSEDQIEPGETFSYVFSQQGSYQYTAGDNITGSVIVD